ncbi:hypothetical protein LOC68_08935 [Blastopirellula sp. JC732]|uniref:Tetratricopeptide repeat protein n=1 Tax=Blastopirellula sediminis TaxID=2894196 RepID=A0A9X1MN35_9BACT|nr:hypothetical protein [Blastopirellula sediminis]MCC9608704.1 hypothetical protein [Blastopirellula sediminis]MCC9628519.1 hypothetical protein [Blastopirellula sediminis]
MHFRYLPAAARLLVLVVVAALSFVSSSLAQGRGRPPAQTPPEPTTLDPRLLKFQKEFVEKAEDLGDEYARKQEWGKAKAVFTEILKLAPQYKTAQDKMDAINRNLIGSNRKTVTIAASGDWRDTGINVSKGALLKIAAEGKWTFVFEGDADGIEPPRELRDIKLGSLVGYIAIPGDKKPQPFMIGKSKEFSAPATGRLFLKMFDIDNSDNQGTMTVEIGGEFE